MEICMTVIESLNRYRELRHRAEVLSDVGDYNLASAEMNPVIATRFAELLSDEAAKFVWEPFANPDGRTFPVFAEIGVKHIAHSLSEGHPDIIYADSSIDGPECEVDGVLFHPPYFGSKPLSDDERDLSAAADEDEWLVLMESAAEIAMESLTPEGAVCAIGRRYRYDGKEIRLDEWLIMAFNGLTPVEVWSSEPDVAIVLRFAE
jgi:hypothetical protein